METGAIYTGTTIFALIGILGCCGFNWLLGNQLGEGAQKSDNKKYPFLFLSPTNKIRMIVVYTGMTMFCMWLLWVCAYMHQMHPITPPEIIIKH
jgi:hypothetical protein